MAAIKFSFFKVLPAAMALLTGLAEAAEDGKIDQDEIMDIVKDLIISLGIKAHIDVE